MTGVQTCALPICFPVTIERDEFFCVLKNREFKSFVKSYNGKFVNLVDAMQKMLTSKGVNRTPCSLILSQMTLAEMLVSLLKNSISKLTYFSFNKINSHVFFLNLTPTNTLLGYFHYLYNIDIIHSIFITQIS